MTFHAEHSKLILKKNLQTPTLQASGLGSFLHAPRIILASSKLNPFSWTTLADLLPYESK
jgi:hypothetical protein